MEGFLVGATWGAVATVLLATLSSAEDVYPRLDRFGNWVVCSLICWALLRSAHPSLSVTLAAFAVALDAIYVIVSALRIVWRAAREVEEETQFQYLAAAA